jgi:outer membrane lipoprotein-sorting protein
MVKRIGLLVVALAMTTNTVAADTDADARELVRKVLEALPKDSFEAKMTVSSGSFEPRELRMVRHYVEDAHGTYLEVSSPDDLEGIRFLFLERPDKPNEQFIKVKASRTAIQVSEEVRRQPFLGSTFYVSDLVMPNLDDYSYKYVGKDVVGERTVTLVEMTPKDPESDIYSKTVAALDPVDLIVLRREYFDKEGTKIKVWTVDKLDKIKDTLSPMGQKMVDLRTGDSSRLDVGKVDFDAEVTDALFTPKYLLR